MRRLLRKIACLDCDDLGDVSTLVNPHIVEELTEAVKTSDTDVKSSSSSPASSSSATTTGTAESHAKNVSSSPVKKTYEELVQEKREEGEGMKQHTTGEAQKSSLLASS